MTKKELRQALLVKRNSLRPKEIEEASVHIVSRILRLEAYKEATSIMAYLAFGKEVSIDALIEQAWHDGKKVYVPFCTEQPGIMVPALLSSWEQVELGRYGIRIPTGTWQQGDCARVELVLVPGLSFDGKGGRLGMGAGYYDRFLPNAIKAVKIGICMEAMLYEKGLPMSHNDFIVENVMTEHRFFQ